MSPIGSIVMSLICIAFLAILVWVFRGVMRLKKADLTLNVLSDVALLTVLMVGFATLAVVSLLKGFGVITE